MTSKIVSDSVIAAAAKAAGFAGEDLVTAVALCFAESGGDQYGVNLNYSQTDPSQVRSVDLGLWQVNSLWSTEPGYYWQVLTPEGNARFAFKIFSEGDVSKSPAVRSTFFPWVAWRNRASIVDWPGFMARARAATGVVDPNAKPILWVPAGFSSADRFGPNTMSDYDGHPIRSGYDGRWQREISAIQRAVGVPPDGYYGSKTADAVEAYQAQHKLNKSGVVGGATWNSLKIFSI